MMDLEFFDDGTATLLVPKDFFESTCIIEAASEFTSRCFFSFEIKEDKIAIHMTPIQGKVSEKLAGIFANRLLEHQCWRELNKEFGHIRDKIIDQAFAPLNNGL